MRKIHFIETTPEELKKEIVKDLRTTLLRDLKKEMQPQEPAAYIPRIEFIKMFQINAGTERNWRKKGVIKAHYVEGKIYYIRKDIDNLLVELNP